MRLTPEDTFAEMLRSAYDELSDFGQGGDADENPVQIRQITETETSTDQTEQSVDTDPGWTWGTSEWGFDVWG